MKEQNTDSKQKISCIANNQEKFMSIYWNTIRFIDSFQFMALSLQKISSYLFFDQKVQTIKYLKERFGDKLNQQELEQILNKGLFPYSWFDSIRKLEQKKFLLQKDFYDDLNDKSANREEYKQSKKLYEKLGFKIFKDWFLLYQTLDIKLITDVWINFRDLSLKNYKLDPGHYYISPGLSWDAELISDPNMNLMFERQSRGGINTTGNKRYVKANNINCLDYDESKFNTQVSYLNANNLYGHAMIQKLPTGNFKWIDESKFEQYSTDIILKYDNQNIGYVYEVDLIYPQKLHDKHNYYPLTPEQKNIEFEDLSDYNKKLMNELKSQFIKLQ